MPTLGTRVGRSLLAVRRRAREWRMLADGIRSTDHPVLAHIIPIRRCNLACSYCNEYDDFSKPVPVDEMLRRIDLLAALGTSIISFSGGEPLLHPELDALIARIRKHGRLAGMITNGYLLNPDRIQKLNRAGLDHMQISIDNVKPDDVSKKSLKTLDVRLLMLAEHSEFHVNINSVVGGGIHNAHDAVVVAERAVELGFTSTVGIIHDTDGQLQALSEDEQNIYLKVRDMGKKNYARLNYFQDNIAHGVENRWKCRAGARYLYVCEEGLVHYCSQQRGYPAKPLALYTKDDIRREFITEKACAPRCTVACVHYTSYMDFWRSPQTIPAPPAAQQSEKLVQLQTR
ncbi:MAG TPA: radical SAM protein [Bryobacteraceae bacterium]|nr:radical SAM protein [Bryobacteraceae bacterium]